MNYSSFASKRSFRNLCRARNGPSPFSISFWNSLQVQCSRHTGVVQTLQHCAPVYVRAVRSGKERPDKSHFTRKVHITRLQVSLGSSAVRQPKKRSLLRLTDTSHSTSLHSTRENGGRVDTNASRVLTTRPSGGRNCPRVSIAILRQICSIMS